MPDDASSATGSSSPSRRGVLGAFGAGGAGLVLGGAAGALWSPRNRADAAKPSAASGTANGALDSVSMFGEHQAGIATTAQDRMHTAAFDLTTKDVKDVIQLLKDWSSAIGYMSQGLPVGGTSGTGGGDLVSVPQDTGEAAGLTAAHLTVTIGFGRSVFVDAHGKDRFGLKDKLPEGLIELPHFSGDMLEKNRSGGDLVVQACADDPQVAVHAVRNLSRIAFGTASIRWSQIGFGRTASTSVKQATPRNLFGFKDGTANLKVEKPKLLDEHVWVSGLKGNQAWLNGGTFMVARRIRMYIEVWDSQQLGEQELVVGRSKSIGAPLSGGEEFTDPDFSKKADGKLAIARDSHVALAHPSRNKGAQMLRRGYNYADGSDGLGRLDAGLFFIAFVVDPRTHYVPIQSRISKNDQMQEYLRHTGSGLYAVPRGLNGAGGYLGQELFEG
jgi:deferrochelatase/peroxidase EfeB